MIGKGKRERTQGSLRLSARSQVLCEIRHAVVMLPFACGARNLRSLRSTLTFSAKVARRSLIARTQVKSARSICVTDVADGQWLNRRIQEVVNKNETRMFASTTCSVSVAYSSILLLTLEDSSNVISVEASGDDDEVGSSAGGKRKHWKKYADAG